MSWRLAPCLVKLFSQVNTAWPNRSRVSDGTIGDASHSSRTSDHNPDPSNVVRAADITHDPAHGADMNKVSEALRKSRDPRIKYVIWNRRIYSGSAGPSPWVWRSYSGTNPHDKHMHVSVVSDGRANDTYRWKIAEPKRWYLTAKKGTRKRTATRRRWKRAKSWIRDKARNGWRVIVRRK